MHAFVKARCTQCHVAAGHGVNLGPALTESVKRLRGRELLAHVFDPSLEIADRYRVIQFVLDDGRVVSGVVVGESDDEIRVVPNLLDPSRTLSLSPRRVEERIPARVSAMPAGLVNVLSREEIVALVAFVEAGDDLPPALRHAPLHSGQ
jgi:putative heme-binding domain-containing protein